MANQPYENVVLDLTFPAGSSASQVPQFVGVQFDANGNVNAASVAGAAIVGVSQDTPATGSPCPVRALGVTKMVAGAALATPGVALSVNNLGQAIPQASTDITIGYLLDVTAAAAGDIVSVRLV